MEGKFTGTVQLIGKPTTGKLIYLQYDGMRINIADEIQQIRMEKSMQSNSFEE